MRRARVGGSWLVVVASLLMLLVASGAALAQSGRRTQKGSPSPPVAVQPEPTPTPAAKPPAQPQINVIVISDISQTLYLSVPFPERVPTWVAKRLRDSQSLAVMQGEQASRGDAVKKAKAAKDTFVVFLRVDETGNSSAMGRTGRANLSDVSISYYVYAPVTGKSQSSGVVYLNQRSTLTGLGRIRTAPLCYPGVRGNDLLLLDASLEVADRIFSALNLSTPPICS